MHGFALLLSGINGEIPAPYGTWFSLDASFCNVRLSEVHGSSVQKVSHLLWGIGGAFCRYTSLFSPTGIGFLFPFIAVLFLQKNKHI